MSSQAGTQNEEDALTALSRLGESSSRVRASRACELCRVKRIKCRGPLPCYSCLLLGEAGNCRVRDKARPNRSRSNRSTHLDSSSVPLPARKWFDLIATVEGHISSWCARHGLDKQSLALADVPRINSLTPTSIQPNAVRYQIEDGLLSHFELIHSGKVRYLQAEYLRPIYTTISLAPSSIPADLHALVSSVLGVASFARFRTGMSSNGSNGLLLPPERAPRDDVAYFQRAVGELEECKEPSLPALWALELLIGYAVANGSASEMRSLVQQQADWIKQMGLHRRETMSLYPEEDAVERLLFSCFYMDCLTASCSGCPPAFKWGTFDIESSFPSHIPRQSRQVAMFESELYGRMQDQTPMTIQYIMETESKWVPHLRKMHDLSEHEFMYRAYANIRLNWLWITLRYSLMDDPTMGASSCKIISGCVNDILWMHLELKRRSIACLSPCWPQLRRIVTCGQLLVLCHDRGELSQAEFLSILEILQDLLAAHHDSWPVAEELSKHFAGIATMNGAQRKNTMPMPTENLFVESGDALGWTTLFNELQPWLASDGQML